MRTALPNKKKIIPAINLLKWGKTTGIHDLFEELFFAVPVDLLLLFAATVELLLQLICKSVESEKKEDDCRYFEKVHTS